MAAEAPKVTTASTTVLTTGTGEDIYPSQLVGRNQELRNDVDDTAGAITALHDELTTVIQEMKAKWTSACDHHSRTIQNYTNEMALPPGAVPYTQNELTEQAQLKLDVPFIEEYGKVSEPIPSVSTLLPQFELLQKKGLRLGERNDFTEVVGRDCGKLLPLGQYELVPTMLQMNDLHHCDPLGVLKAEFNRLFQELAAVEAQLSQAAEEREAALRSEDVVTAEERGALVLALYNEMLGIVKKRTQHSEDHEDQVKDFHANVNEFIQQVQLEEGEHKMSVIMADASKDITAIEEAMQAAEQSQTAAHQEFDERTKMFRRELVSNSTEQSQIWDEILKLMGQLPALQQQRVEMVNDQIERVNQYQKQKSQHSSFINECTTRLEQVQQILSNCTAAKEVLVQGEKYVRSAMAAIQAKNVDGQLAQMQKDEKIRYYDVYRRYVLFGGELLQRKQQRLENNRRLIRGSEFQINHAVESLDPDINVYKDQLKLFRKKEMELSSAILEIKTQLDAEQVQWSPVEAALEDMDVTIEPPTLLLQELQRDLTEKHASAVDDLTTTEQRALDQEKNTVRKLQNACVAAKTSIEERRATRQAALNQLEQRPAIEE